MLGNPVALCGKLAGVASSTSAALPLTQTALLFGSVE